MKEKSIDICGNPTNVDVHVDIRADIERGNAELLRKREEELAKSDNASDGEKAGWIYSCATGERFPYDWKNNQPYTEGHQSTGIGKPAITAYNPNVTGINGVAIGRQSLSISSRESTDIMGLTEQLMIDGYDIHVSLDPASETPEIMVWKSYKNGVVSFFDNKNVIRNFNFNDPKILKMLGEKYNATGNQDSL